MKKHPPHWRLEEVLPRNGIKAIGPAPAIVWLFLGEVYEGDVGDESRPLQPKFPTQKSKPICSSLAPSEFRPISGRKLFKSFG